jgi:hypothetical protein
LKHSAFRRCRRIVAAVTVIAAFAPASAVASTGGAQPPACATETPRQVFAAFGDRAWYWLAPGGAFEDGAPGWTLTGGAAVADGNAPFGLGGATDSHSLSLPRGASAVSAPFCIRRDARIVRWVQRSTRRGLLRVDVIDARSRRLAVVRGTTTWRPSRKLRIPLRGASATVALRFTAVRGDWSIDDLYLDPRLRH